MLQSTRSSSSLALRLGLNKLEVVEVMVVFVIFFLLAIVSGSVIEWVVHKYVMHSIKWAYFTWMRTPHDRHAVMHHAQRRAPGKFYAKEEELKEYHLFETSFMPILWVLHLPCIYPIYLAFGFTAYIGMAAGTAAYVGAYEILHWSVHCPDNFPFRTHRWFLFLTEHHRRHHKKNTINYNVVLPLADLVFGTYEALILMPEPEDLRVPVTA